MSDFITISCPSCGGQLRRDANTTTYTCDYCGQQHRLRMEDIEEFGRCPVCHRNDRVEIVRALYTKGGNLASRLAPPANPKVSHIYQRPTKPEPPEKPAAVEIGNGVSCLGVVLVVLSLFFLFTQLFANYIPAILLFSVGILLLSFGVFIEPSKKLSDEWQLQNDKIEKKWREELQEYDKLFSARSTLLTDKYARAMQCYDLLYYCHRDDIVFIPGESGYAPSAKIDEFLFREIDENNC